MIEQFIEESQKLIPISLKNNLQKKEFRLTILNKHGPEAFLNPDELKYPIYDLKGFHCGLCYAAYLRAKQNNETAISSKAKKLFSKYNCENDLNIHIGEGQVIDFLTFIELFEYQLDDLDFIEVI